MAYKVQLAIGNETINMYPVGQQGSGNPAILLATIGGWTGVNANIGKSVTANGVGEVVTSSTIGGRVLQFKGFILDGNEQSQFAAKLKMLSLLQPNVEVEATFTPLNNVAAVGITALRGKSIVKASPTFTQEKHSRFVFDLYFPFPYLEATAGVDTIELTENLNASVATIARTEAPTPYVFSGTVKSGGRLKEFTLYGKGGSLWIRCDLTKVSDSGYLGAGDKFELVADFDKVRLLVQSGGSVKLNKNQCIDLSSNFWLLPIGADGFRFETTPASGVSGNQLVDSKGVITYTPLRLCTMLSEA